MKLTISGYSTALFSTWYFIDELGILFDAGDGVVSSLTQKGGKVKNVFISHADRDHLTGLLQLNQLNARDGFPKIHYPKDCGSFEALKDFSTQFDHQVKNTTWIPTEAASEIKINNRLHVETIENGHVRNPKGIKSLSYKIVELKNKLKPEFSTLNKLELKEMAIKHGSDFITGVERVEVFGYSGDTPVEDLERWRNTKVLIHEATFLSGEDHQQINAHGNAHSHLEDVLMMVAESKVEQLILGHFSARYSKLEIEKQIIDLSKKYNIKIPIYSVLPGEVSFDILSGDPVN